MSHDTLQQSDKTIRDVSVPVNAILTDLPETAQTKALSATINTYLGNDFVINHVDAAKGQQNLCKYSSSRPHFCFYHTKNYFNESNIFAAVTPTTPGGAIEESGFEPDTDINPDTDSHAGTIYRASGEDKIRDPYIRGQGQLVAVKPQRSVNLPLVENNFLQRPLYLVL